MAPKSKINAQMIADVSYEILKKEGEGALNARSIASGLECSTQPIYSYYKDMKDLIGVLTKMANDEFFNMIASSLKDENPFLALSLNYVKFAKDNENVFKFMFFSHYSEEIGPESIYGFIANKCSMGDFFGNFSKMYHISDEGYKQAFINVWSYVHGVASFASVSHTTNEELFKKIVIALLKSEFMRISFGG